MVNVLRRLGHIDLALVVEPSQEVGQSPAVVEVRVGYYHHRDLVDVHLVEQGQTVRVLLVDHEPAVQHYLLVVDGQDQAAPAHLAPCPEGEYRHMLHLTIYNRGSHEPRK